jgi:two-component system cell cycle sensor histidine kinase/response regulator CckA
MMAADPIPHYLASHYDPLLVAVSVVIAVTASYAALDLASRVTAARGAARATWVVGGAIAMGIGIWGMHYTGMVAFQLPVTVLYDVGTVLVSLLAAVFASAVALWVVSRREMTLAQAVSGSVVMGSGIAIMHYTGMAAMRLPARMSFDALLVGLSILIAIIVSLVALWLAFRLRGDAGARWSWRKLATALLMGAAIPSMHYTGMAAARFQFSGSPVSASAGVDISSLGTAAIVVSTFTILGLAIAMSLVDRRFSAQAVALQASEEQHQKFLRQVIDTNPQLVFVKDWDGKFVLVNRAAADIYGTTVEGLVGKCDADFNLNKEEVEHFLRDDREVMASGRSKSIFEEPVTDTRTGEPRWFQTIKVPLLSPNGNAPQVLGVSTDVTHRRQAEQELRRTSYTLQTLIDAAPLAIYALDAEGRVRSWNRAAEQMFGWPAAEVVGQPLAIVPTEDLDAFRESLARLFRGEAITGLQVRRTRQDGITLDIRVCAAPTRGPDGLIDGVIVIAEDVTERKSLGEQLRQAQKMEAIGQLTGGIAHDFNNLLTIVITNAALLKDQIAADQADMRSELSELQRAALRGAELIRKLMAFSRQRPLELRPLNLAEVINETHLALQRLLPASVEVSAQVDGNRPLTINGDVGAIEQMLFNLATNARDAMPNGGALRVAVYRGWLDEEHRRTRGWGKAGEYIVLAVSDTGCGMTPETRARVFDPFFTTKEVGKGTGLGMAMVYGLVKQHDGYIDLSSEPGHGTTIRLYFPAVAFTLQAAGSEPVAAAPVVGGTERILVVDDEEGIRRSAVRLLTRYGYQVEEAGDGEAALAALGGAATRFDLVLSDLIMPKLGGLALYEELRRRNVKARILLMSGYTAEDIQALNGANSGVSFLNKPWTVTDLLRRVREVLDEPI